MMNKEDTRSPSHTAAAVAVVVPAMVMNSTHAIRSVLFCSDPFLGEGFSVILWR